MFESLVKRQKNHRNHHKTTLILLAKLAVNSSSVVQMAGSYGDNMVSEREWAKKAMRGKWR